MYLTSFSQADTGHFTLGKISGMEIGQAIY